MAEFTFKLDKGEGKEYPVAFKGQEFTFWTPDAPKDDADWDGVVASLREMYDGAISAYAGNAAAYNLDRQKAIKVLLNAEGATLETVRATATAEAFRKTHRRLRGMGGSTRTGGARKVSAATEAKVKTQLLDEMLADETLDAATRQLLEARKAKLTALGVSTPDAKPADAPAAGKKNK